MNNKFKITYDEHSDLFMMNGYGERWAGAHLLNIAKVFGIIEVLKALSESHMVAILCENNIDVELDFEY